MAFQPNDCAGYMARYDLDDTDQLLLHSLDLRNPATGFTFSEGSAVLNTPTFPMNNPFTTLASTNIFVNGGNVSNSDVEEPPPRMSINEESLVPVEDTYQQVDDSISDIELDDVATTNNAEQPSNINAQEAIAAIADGLRRSVDELTATKEFEAIITAMNRHGPSRMRMRRQPIARHRFRYRSDRISYLEQFRKKPMTVEFSNLNGCLSKLYQSFWLQVTIVTTRHNPQHRVFKHQLEIFYNGESAEQNGLQSFHIPLTDKDIRRSRKRFRHLSVIKTKLNNYTFELTPFDPLLGDDHAQHYTTTNDDQLSKVQKAKRFDREYHTENYQIVCQLLIKQKDRWYPTHLFCETHVVADS